MSNVYRLCGLNTIGCRIRLVQYPIVLPFRDMIFVLFRIFIIIIIEQWNPFYKNVYQKHTAATKWPGRAGKDLSI